MSRVKVALWAAVLAGLGSIAATIWVGASVREDAVVEKPYEEGLRQDAERAARRAAGLAVALEEVAPRAGAGPIAFRLADAEGRAVEGARVAVELSRAETSRGAVRADAREVAPGRYAADLAFPAAGPWDVRVDVARGGERVRLETRVVASAGCDLAERPCSLPLAGGGEVTLALGPRPLRTMQELTVRVETRGTPTATPTPTVSFHMPGMDMGENRATLAPSGPDAWTGKAVLVRCPSGRRAWVAEVAVPGAASVRFPLTVTEGR